MLNFILIYLTMKIFRTAKTSMPAIAEPGVITTEGNRLFVNTTDNLLEILELQITGKKRMPARDFLNGFKIITQYHCTHTCK